ncbi:coenzyme PQQ precursor peptide PqqA [Bradyrhizobium sp. F1.13.4]
MKKYLGITKFQLGRLYRIESCTALTTALSGQGSRPNAPCARQHHQQVLFRLAFFAPQHGLLGKISLANFSTRTNLGVGRIRPNSRKWRAEMAWKAPKIVEVPCGMEINMYVSATRK